MADAVLSLQGLRKNFGGFAVDLSNTFGRNELRYDVRNSLNASLYWAA